MLNQQCVSPDAIGSPAPSGKLSVIVVFTTIPATLVALRDGAKLAGEVGAPVRVLVPSVVPYPLELTRPRVDPLFRLRHFRTHCAKHSVETLIDVRLCRDRTCCIRDALAPHSLVFIGARKRLWPWLYETLLARQLRQDGHEVLLVPAPARRFQLSCLARATKLAISSLMPSRWRPSSTPWRSAADRF
jgi:hypothetical protein